ncbi:MAG: hypothetical protein J5699_04725 [Bacteroidales bacterium]|nr:hypothetical protein [Bacteroidales bacterium]
MTTVTDPDSVNNNYERPRSGEIAIEAENVFSQSGGNGENIGDDPIIDNPDPWTG